ncbi:MAG: DUF1385 domain-containing protein [Eggerthellaceae bacterium]|nr:DUF1385 domain-containing protein [Eggerthellaceae bacterium]
MMRGKLNWAVAVREPGGGIYVEEHDLASGRKKNSWLTWPFVRGCTALVESLALGFKALAIAADHAFDDEDEKAEAQAEAAVDAAESLEVAADPVAPSEAAAASHASQAAEGSASQKGASAESGAGFSMVIPMVLGAVMGVVLFIVAPAALANLIAGEYDERTLAWNLVDGVGRVAIFILYIWLIGRMSDIRRMFMYHGAEHKTIHCFEHGLPLTPENARSFPRLHVRCGTAFLIMVMVIAIIVYTLVPLNALISALGVPDGPAKFALVVAVRVLLMPLIAGISYEITVKWAGSRPENPVVKVILWPGMQMQRLTTNEPDDGQLECAITAMERVLAREEQAAREAEAAEALAAAADGEGGSVSLS